MFVQTKALVLHSLKYNDSSLIVHCYTQELGRQSFLVKGVLSSRKGRFRKALFQPLMLLDLSFQMKKKRRAQLYQRCESSASLQQLLH